MSKSRCRVSEAEREERRERDRERLKQAADQLLTSEGWKRWVRARGCNGLARYSVSNLCLILLAQPDASFVAGFKAWLELGYCVRKGERAIRIFAKRALLRLMQRRDAAVSVAWRRAAIRRRGCEPVNCVAVCGGAAFQRLPFCIRRDSVAFDAKRC